MAAIKALRASAWTLFAMGVAHLFGHLLGHYQMNNSPDPKIRALVAAMQGFNVDEFPIRRNILEIYNGLSISLAAFAMIAAALVLISAQALKDNPEALRRLVRVYLAGTFVLTVIAVQYFVWPPTVFLLVSFGLAAFSLARLRKAV